MPFSFATHSHWITTVERETRWGKYSFTSEGYLQNQCFCDDRFEEIGYRLGKRKKCIENDEKTFFSGGGGAGLGGRAGKWETAWKFQRIESEDWLSAKPPSEAVDGEAFLFLISLYDADSENVIPGPAAIGPSGRLLEVHILGPNIRSTETETLGWI